MESVEPIAAALAEDRNEFALRRREGGRNDNLDQIGALVMITPQSILDYVKAKPFRPFRIHMASGRTFDIRHPEMIKVLKSTVLVFKSTGDTPEIPDEWESLSVLLTESLSHLEAPVSS